MHFYLQYKTLILRTLGMTLLVIAIATEFWISPKEGLSENEKAALRVARMEASTKSTASRASSSHKKDDTKFLEKLQNTQSQQKKYMLYIAMVLGSACIAYSFIPQKKRTR